MIELSPFHKVELAEEYQNLVDQPPDHDQIMRVVSKKMANGQPLIQGELVLAGNETRNAFPLAGRYPVHFRKTYYPTCFHQHPDQELENHQMAADILHIPPPIGATRTSFRSCFIPGKPLSRISPFGTEPPESNIATAQEAETALLIGLWDLLSNLYDQVTQLHDGGLAHGDLYLHNAIVSTSPVRIFLIDYELAVKKRDCDSEEKWQKAVDADLRELLTEAIYVQAGLGSQRGPLAEASLEALPVFFEKTHRRFQRAISQRSNL